MNKQQLLDHLKNEVYCRLRPSNIKGVGIFAIRKIPQGTNPFPHCENDVVMVSKEEIEQLDPEVQTLIYSFCAPDDGMFCVPDFGLNKMNISFYLNHSKDPNIISEDGMTFFAKRDIEKDEELTIDYAAFDDNYDYMLKI